MGASWPAAATGAFAGLDRGPVDAALTVASMIAGPVHDLGRIVEYRQNDRAARRSISPALPHTTPGAGIDSKTGAGPVPGSPCEVAVSGLEAGGTLLPPLAARPGEIILVDGLDHASADELFESLLGISPSTGAFVTLDGKDLGHAIPLLRRRCIGYAARGLHLERGQLLPAIRYRCPDADDSDVAEAVTRAGLEDAIARLPRGGLTVLRCGGEPLTAPQPRKGPARAREPGNPPLLLLNRIDADSLAS